MPFRISECQQEFALGSAYLPVIPAWGSSHGGHPNVGFDLVTGTTSRRLVAEVLSLPSGGQLQNARKASV